MVQSDYSNLTVYPRLGNLKNYLLLVQAIKLNFV